MSTTCKCGPPTTAAGSTLAKLAEDEFCHYCGKLLPLDNFSNYCGVVCLDNDIRENPPEVDEECERPIYDEDGGSL